MSAPVVVGANLLLPHLLIECSPYRKAKPDFPHQVVANFIGAEARFDCYCPDCKQPSLFSAPESREHRLAQLAVPGRGSEPPGLASFGLFSRTYVCERNRAHSISVVVAFHRDGSIEKVGQSPSAYDLLAIDKAKHARELEDAGRADEFVRAQILHSYGFGIAAFLYVRRVLEHIVNLAERDASNEGKLHKFDTQYPPMHERIAALPGFLPDVMVRNAHAYKLLSEGVHSLNDEVCARHFGVLKGAVELFMAEHASKREQAGRISELEKRMSQLANEFSKK
jgi:hypothetical protein